MLCGALHYPAGHLPVHHGDRAQWTGDGELGGHRSVGGYRHHRPRVRRDGVCDLGRCVRVDGHCDGPGRLDAQVAVQPFEAVLGKQDHAVPALHAALDERRSHRKHVASHCIPALHLPRIAVAVMNQRPIAIACRLAEEHADGGAVGDTFGVQLAGCGLRCPYGHLGLAT